MSLATHRNTEIPLNNTTPENLNGAGVQIPRNGIARKGVKFSYGNLPKEVQ